MLNEALGAKSTCELGDCIRSEPGRAGHAVWGPYQPLAPGCYEVEFLMRRTGPPLVGANDLCAVIDVATDCGRRSNHYDFIFASQIGEDFRRFKLPFRLQEAAEAEYRVHVTGATALEICELRTVRTLGLGERSWVEPSCNLPHLLRDHRPMAKAIHDSGGSFALSGSDLIATLNGIRFCATSYDDVNFVEELFSKQAYNFSSGRPSCVIDVGMNVGLASLLFAAKPGVQEVHSFEPFPETFERGLANLALNSNLAERIRPYGFGLGDGDATAVFYVGDTKGDSGGQSTRNVEGGRPVSLAIKDAGQTFVPILKSARQRNLFTVAKIDCEGAEFDIFPSIERAGLWGDIDLLMVEWHRVHEGRGVEELIAPLHRAGFAVIDLSPPHGNGFFYAFRAG